MKFVATKKKGRIRTAIPIRPWTQKLHPNITFFNSNSFFCVSQLNFTICCMVCNFVSTQKLCRYPLPITIRRCSMNYNAQLFMSDLCKSTSIKTKLQPSDRIRFSAALIGMTKYHSVNRTQNRRLIIYDK